MNIWRIQIKYQIEEYIKMFINGKFPENFVNGSSNKHSKSQQQQCILFHAPCLLSNTFSWGEKKGKRKVETGAVWYLARLCEQANWGVGSVAVCCLRVKKFNLFLKS